MTTTMEKQVNYPESDGKPMAENNTHVLTIMLVHQALEDFFLLKKQQCWIASNIFWFWEEGNPVSRVSPDTMVIRGNDPDTNSFFSWKSESTRPEIIFEITSRKTRKDDVETKFNLYESLGVPEYVMFDPKNTYLFPRLQHYVLDNGVYRNVTAAGGDCISPLGFFMRVEGRELRLFDCDNGKKIPSRRELYERAQQADQLEIENAQLRAIIKHLKPNGNGS